MGYTEFRLPVSRVARWGLLGMLTPDTRDVWMALHGYAQLASDFAEAARWPVSPERAFVFPEALQRFYDSDHRKPGANAQAPVVASWMTRKAREDDIADNHGYLDALWHTVRASAPKARLHVLGFSQGAATAARWSAARAAAGDPPRRLVMWAGILPDEVDISPRSPFRRVATTLVVGTRDPWAPAERIAAERARLAARKLPAEIVTFDGGHRMDDTMLIRLIESFTED